MRLNFPRVTQKWRSRNLNPRGVGPQSMRLTTTGEAEGTLFSLVWNWSRPSRIKVVVRAPGTVRGGHRNSLPAGPPLTRRRRSVYLRSVPPEVSAHSRASADRRATSLWFPGRGGKRKVCSRRRAASVALRASFAASLRVASGSSSSGASEEPRAQRLDGKACVCPRGSVAQGASSRDFCNKFPLGLLGDRSPWPEVWACLPFSQAAVPTQPMSPKPVDRTCLSSLSRLI